MKGISKIIANMQKARYLRKMTENESHIVFFVEKIEKTAMFHTFHRLFVDFVPKLCINVDSAPRKRHLAYSQLVTRHNFEDIL